MAGRTLEMAIAFTAYTSTMENGVNYDLFHPNVHRTTLIPVFDLAISQGASDSQKELVKTLLYDMPKYTHYGSLAGYVIGGSCLLIGLAWWMAGKKAKSKAALFAAKEAEELKVSEMEPSQ